MDVIPSFICDETTQPIVPDHRIISTAEALESIDNLKYWLMSQEECDPSLLLKLADWENFATKRLLTELKQSIVANSVVNSSKL